MAQYLNAIVFGRLRGFCPFICRRAQMSHSQGEGERLDMEVIVMHVMEITQVSGISRSCLVALL